MKTSITCLLALVMAVSGHAQWEYGGKYIGIGRPAVYPQLAADGSGGVFVVWQGCNDEFDSSYVTLNHFDTAGVALFGDAGMVVASGPRDDYGEPRIASDGLGGCFVIWDQVLPNGATPMYLQRIGYNGEHLWPENKRLIYRSGYVNSYLRGLQLLADTSFGVVAVCKFGAGYTCILGQRVDYGGNLLWDSLGIIIRDTTDNWNDGVSCLKLCRSEDWFYCTWLDGRNFNQNNGDIYLQRFDFGGSIYFGQSGGPVSTAEYTDGFGDQRESLQMVPDGSGGVVVGWVYDDLILSRTLKAQRIDSGGHTYWGLNGMRLTNYERSDRFGLGLLRIGDLLWAMVLGGFQSRCQKIDINGNMVYGDSGCVFLDTIYASAVSQDTLYLMDRVGNYFFGSKKDTSWTEYWLSYIHGWIEEYDILPDGLGGLYAAFTLIRNWPTDWVLLQRIYPDGHFGGDTTAIVEDADQLPKNCLSLMVYPNPFNSSATISFNMPSEGKATVEIYDNLGRAIDAFSIGNLSKGPQRFVWEHQKKGLHLGSGVYFITVLAEGYEDKSVFTLIK